MDFYWADEPAALALKIIDDNHPHLKDLPIAYVFKAVPPKKKKANANGRVKKVTMARTSKISEANKCLMVQRFEFKIEFDHAIWVELAETPEKQLALVDHELSHCGNDAEGTYLIPHSIEEISAVVERHGLWKSDVAQFAATIDHVLHPLGSMEALDDAMLTSKYPQKYTGNAELDKLIDEQAADDDADGNEPIRSEEEYE